MGVERGIIACGNSSTDEITNTGKTHITEINGDNITTYDILPSDFGIPTASAEDIKGGTGEENALIVKDILSGAKGPKRDVVLMNAGAAIYIAGIAKNMAEGIKLAEESIDSGKAMNVLNALIAFTNK